MSGCDAEDGAPAESPGAALMHPDEAAQIDNECDEIAALVADDRVLTPVTDATADVLARCFNPSSG